MKQISRDRLSEVYRVGECQMVVGGQFQHLRYILLLTLDILLFLFEVN
jgi:hypothetical protein